VSRRRRECPADARNVGRRVLSIGVCGHEACQIWDRLERGPDPGFECRAFAAVLVAPHDDRAGDAGDGVERILPLGFIPIVHDEGGGEQGGIGGQHLADQIGESVDRVMGGNDQRQGRAGHCFRASGLAPLAFSACA